MKLNRDGLVVAYGTKGRGVFTARPFKTGDIIEVAPHIVLNAADQRGRITRYTFAHPDNEDLVILVAGHGMLFNHDTNNNVHYEVRETETVFFADEDIEKWEELFINYGEHYDWGFDCYICGEQHDGPRAHDDDAKQFKVRVQEEDAE